MSLPPASLRHVAIAVGNLPRALDFYTRTLGFQSYHTADGDWAMLRRDGSTLSLILDPAAVPAGKPGAVHPSHFGLNVDSPEAVDLWYRHLKEAGAPHLRPPKGHRDGSYGFYLEDTEGNSLEIIYIPPVQRSSGS